MAIQDDCVVTCHKPWFIDSGRCDAASGCALPSYDRCSVVWDLRFLVRVLTFQASEASIVLGTVGVYGLGLSWQRVSAHSQVAVGSVSLYGALTVQAAQVSFSEKGGFCKSILKPVEPVCALAAVWYPLTRVGV